MRKRTQRISAILLSLAMVLTALPFNLVYADSDAANQENPANETTENQQNNADEQNAAADKENAESASKSEAAEKKASPKVSEPKAQADENADKEDASDSKKDADNKDADSKEEKTVTIKSIPVAYADGKAVEDGHKLDFFRSDMDDEGTTYTVKDGKISDVKLVAGVPYKIAISWNDPDEYFSWDYEMAFAQDLYVRVIVSENSKYMMGYDNDAKKATGKAVTKLVIKEMDALDPAEETVTIPSVTVRYANRKPVEDGHVLNFARSDQSTEGEDYTVKNGKITNVKLAAGVPYKVSISWDDPDEDFPYDYEMAYAQDGYVRVTGVTDSKTLMGYDKEAQEVTSPVRELVIKEYDAADPVPQDKEVSVADIPVVYEDGTPVPDSENMELDLINMKSLLDDVQHYYTRYKVKDGKISGIKMNSETEYKIGFDTTNPFWKTHEVVGAYNSKKLMRIFARYNDKLPLQYDYDEGIDGDENQVTKIVVKKTETAQDPCLRPASCWMSLPISDNGYYAESGFSWKLTRLDTGKSKTVYNREGDLTLIGEEKVPYLLTLDENDTYELDFDSNPLFKQYKDRGGIPFHWEADSQGKTQAVLDGYDVEDVEGRLNYNYVDVKRIDGKTNSTGHKFSDDDCEDTEDVKVIYNKDIVTLKGMKVNEVSGNSVAALNKDVTFVFYDSSTQTVEAKVKSLNGVLPDVKMYKDHHYIVYAEDSQYQMDNYYIKLSTDGGTPTTYKGVLRDVTSFDMTKRATELAKPEDAARVHIKMPVYYVDQDGDMSTVGNVKVRLVNQYDTVETTSDADGNIEADLMEDYNYMVLVDSERYSIESFPLTVKDKSEYGAGKYTYNHFSCGSVGALYLVDKGTEHDRDVKMIGSSNNTTVTGLNFGTGSYYINDRVIDEKVPSLEGKDYEVVDIDAINMYRTEISKLSAGDFVITRVIPEGKEVENVYYIDDNGDLHKLDFTVSNGLVTFKMGSISLYNNVIQYKSKEEPSKPTDPTTPTNPSVNAAPKVTLSSTSYTYNGKTKTPSVTVKVNGKKVASKDYTVSYSSGRKKVGTYTVKVTLKSNKKSATATFRINPKKTTLKSVKKGKKAITVKWLRKGPQVTGYQVQYSTSKKFTGKSTKVKTIKGYKHNHKKITKLAKKKKYYARVRTYKVVKGKKYYSTWSKAKSVKTR
ncbi:MAG: hypothetical protein Q4C18_04755 [Eubacteriales bacterium]|nr:hypothetical protein [Eubacteriales bacterium]